MSSLLDRLPVGFVAFTDDGKITAANRTLGAMLQHPGDSFAGQHIESFLTVPSRVFYQTHVFPLLKMHGHIDEVYLTARSSAGEDVPVLINGCRYQEGEGASNECVLVPMRRRDDYENQILEARRQAERANEEKDRINEALQLTQEMLKRQQGEIKDRNCELENLRESLEELVAQRTAELLRMVEDLRGFNYSIAHDLRTPLRAIQATATLLSTEDSEGLTKEQRYHLSRQIHNTKKLAQLVEDLLQFSRLGLAPIERERVDLSAQALTSAHAAANQQKRDNLTFTIEPGLTAEGDRTLIQVVLDNLFDNAIKYSPEGGEVSFGAKRVDGTTAFFVRDEGIGIAPKYVHKIFLPFERLHRDAAFSGTGIGLANVQRIVERHGGRVWVESEPGSGSTFFFKL